MIPWRELLEAKDAPEGFAEWAMQRANLRDAWTACTHPEWMIWMAARLERSPREQHELVAAASFVLQRGRRPRLAAPWPTRVELARRWARPDDGDDNRAGLLCAWIAACVVAVTLLFAIPGDRGLVLAMGCTIATFGVVWSLVSVTRKHLAMRLLRRFGFDDAIDAIYSTAKRNARNSRRQMELADALRRCADEPGRLKLV